MKLFQIATALAAALFVSSQADGTPVRDAFLQQKDQKPQSVAAGSLANGQYKQVSRGISSFRLGVGVGEEPEPHEAFRIKTAGDFLSGVKPPIRDDEMIEVVVLRAYLQKDQPFYIRKIAELFNANHGGIGFVRKSSGVGVDKEGGAVEMQMYAEHGFLNALVPSFLDKFDQPLPVDVEGQMQPNGKGELEPSDEPLVPLDRLEGGSLVWKNSVVVGVANKFDMTYWDEVTKVATISGRELKLLDCWVPQWLRTTQYYNLWAIHEVKDEGTTHPLLESLTCWDFVFDAIAYLKAHEHKKSVWDTQVAANIKKSATKVLSSGGLVAHKWDDAHTHTRQQILHYFALSFAHLVNNTLINGARGYVYDRNTETYWEIPLTMPFYSLSWEAVIWRMHKSQLFLKQCPAPNYPTKHRCEEGVQEFIDAQTENAKLGVDAWGGRPALMYS